MKGYNDIKSIYSEWSMEITVAMYAALGSE